jgi:serine/threonine-protein kinase
MPLEPGDVLDGRYEIEARLGAGGMGEVFKATHRYLGSPRVIKVIHSQIAGSDEARDRFLREARSATKVQHPNVATVHDFASLPDGSHYMVWEFIEGENLAQRLRVTDTLPPREAMSIAVQTLQGLGAIHRAGIIHRDISPENLMITSDNMVKIIDLGVAKLEDPEATSQTRAGMFVGKLRYASPEQLGMLPDTERIDGRADLYSLGVVLVEMLTGRPPYEARSPHEYFILHTGEPRKISRELPLEMSGREELQRILDKSLARDRNERYATAMEMIADLEAVSALLPGGAAKTLSVALPEASAASLAQVRQRDETLQNPLPEATTLQTPVPSPSPVQEPMPLPVKKSSTPRILILSAAVVAAALMLAAGATAIALWTAKKPTAVMAPRTKASTRTAPAQTSVTIATESAGPTTSTAVSEAIPVTTSPDNAAPGTPPGQATPRKRTSTPVETRRKTPAGAPAEAAESAPATSIATYVDGGGDDGVNERTLEEFRKQVKGVKNVSIHAGGMQDELVRAMRERIPGLEITESAAVSIRFEGTFERLGFGRKRRAATASVTKNGQVVFRYELPNIVYRVGMTPAESFARVASDAFLE